MADYETALWWLHLSFRSGAFVDFIMLFPMLIPKIGYFMFGINDKELQERMQSVEYNYAMYIGASLMCGWTILLIWGDQKPFQRKDLLLITIFPVIIGLAASGYYVSVAHNFVAIKEMIPIWCLQFLLCIIFIMSYTKASAVIKKDT